jgi:hypothetical protein
MQEGLRGRVRGTLLAICAAIALVGASCSRSGPVTCGTCLMYNDNCSATLANWQEATGDPALQPFIQEMVTGGCSMPMKYTPCKDHHCNSGNVADDSHFISTCPVGVAQSVVAKRNASFSIVAPGESGTDRCTGVPPQDWAIVMWPFPGPIKHPLPKCPTANCG